MHSYELPSNSAQTYLSMGKGTSSVLHLKSSPLQGLEGSPGVGPGVGSGVGSGVGPGVGPGVDPSKNEL